MQNDDSQTDKPRSNSSAPDFTFWLASRRIGGATNKKEGDMIGKTPTASSPLPELVARKHVVLPLGRQGETNYLAAVDDDIHLKDSNFHFAESKFARLSN